MSEGWLIFIVGSAIAFVTWALQGMVIKRIDAIANDLKESSVKNDNAHKELWQEHNATKNILCERVAKLETQVDIEEQIKRLISTT